MPASTTERPAVLSTSPWTRDLLSLTLIFGALYFFMLGSMPLANPDEGRYAEIPREILQSGDWVLPHLNGVVYFEKPPLVYWCTAIAMHLGGRNEWMARSAPALFALGGVLLTYAIGRLWRDRLTGLIAAAVLGTAVMYFVLARILILDLPLSVLMSATLFCFLMGIRTPPGTQRRWWFYGLYATSALATLAKGLVGFLVTGAVMFSWLLVFNQWRRLLPFYLPTGALLFLAIAAPWHLLAAQRNDAWAEFYFVREHWLRFTTTMHDRSAPWWYFAPILLAGLFPWSGYLWQSVRETLIAAPSLKENRLHATRAGNATASEPRLPEAIAPKSSSGADANAGSSLPSRLTAWWRRQCEAKTAEVWFLITWAAFIFLFFSRSQSKLPPYILPIFPALAVLIAAWLAGVVRTNDARHLRAGLWFWAIGMGLLAAGALAIALHPPLLKERELAEAARPFALALTAAAGAGLLAWPWLQRRSANAGTLILLQGASIAAVYLVLAAAAPSLIHRDTKSLAAIVAARIAPQDKIYHYRGFFHDFVFHTGRFVGTVAHKDELELEIDAAARNSGRFIDESEFRRQWEGPSRVWIVARKSEAARLLSDASFRAHTLGETRKHILLSNRP